MLSSTYKKEAYQKTIDWVYDTFYDVLPTRGFPPRDEQVTLALRIQDAINKKTTLLAEAGVGVGKTYGYLFPGIMRAKNTGKPLIVSTATLALQDQLFYSDIPVVEDILGFKGRLSKAVAKGKENYVCLERLEYYIYTEAWKEEKVLTKEKIGQLGVFIEKSKTGERIEFPGINDIEWKLINAGEQAPCLNCNSTGRCFVTKARKSFRETSHVVVCNHNLFFANFKRMAEDNKESFFQYPSMVVLDEAHALEGAAQGIYGQNINQGMSQKRLNTAKRYSHYAYTRRYAETIQDAMDNNRELFFYLSKNARITEKEEATRFSIVRNPKLYSLSDTLINQIERITEQLAIFSGMASENESRQIVRNIEELSVIQTTLKWLMNEEDYVSWLESSDRRSSLYQIHSVPRNMSEILSNDFAKITVPKIFCSATLSTPKDGRTDFDYVKHQLGVESPLPPCSITSPFDYKKQSLIYISNDLPEPSYDNDFYLRAADKIVQLIRLSAGRALVLFTSHYSLDMIYPIIKSKLPYNVYHQRHGSYGEIVQSFKEDITSVLCGAGAMWEGIDVPGEALSLVIIVKLPFPADDPLLEAKIKVAEDDGGDGFTDVRLPEMLLKLKQGAGRLIRRVDDRGVIAILDRRAAEKSYRHLVVQALPDTKITREIKEVEKFFTM